MQRGGSECKLFIVNFYEVFILNIVSIFYMYRANNSLNNQLEFLATLIIQVFIALAVFNRGNQLNRKQIFRASGQDVALARLIRLLIKSEKGL